MKNRSNWAKTAGVIALGMMVLSPVASYAVDLDLRTRTQERIETRSSQQNGEGSPNRYMNTVERRTQEKKMANKAGEKRRNEARERNQEREHKGSNYGQDRHNSDGVGSGSFESGGSHGRSRGRGR